MFKKILNSAKAALRDSDDEESRGSPREVGDFDLSEFSSGISAKAGIEGVQYSPDSEIYTMSQWKAPTGAVVPESSPAEVDEPLLLTDAESMSCLPENRLSASSSETSDRDGKAKREIETQEPLGRSSAGIRRGSSVPSWDSDRTETIALVEAERGAFVFEPKYVCSADRSSVQMEQALGQSRSGGDTLRRRFDAMAVERTKNVELEEEVTRLRQEADFWQRSYRETAESLKEAMAASSDMSSRAEATTDLKRELFRLQQNMGEVKSLESRNSDMARRYEELKRDRDELAAEVDGLRRGAERSNLLVDQLERESRIDKQRLQDDISSEKRKIAQLEADLSTANAALRREVSAAEENKESQRNLGQAMHRISKLEEEKEVLSQSISKLLERSHKQAEEAEHMIDRRALRAALKGATACASGSVRFLMIRILADELQLEPKQRVVLGADVEQDDEASKSLSKDFVAFLEDATS